MNDTKDSDSTYYRSRERIRHYDHERNGTDKDRYNSPKRNERDRRDYRDRDRMELVEAAILKAQGRPYRFHEIFGFAPRKQPLKT